MGVVFSTRVLLALSLSLSASNYSRVTVTWYGEPYRGHTTASGEIFNPDEFTYASRVDHFGAHRRFYFGSHSVRCRCNDRTATQVKADFDLSRAAFSQLADLNSGRITVLTTSP